MSGTERQIERKEVRFAFHLPKTSYREVDLHYIREDVTYTDGHVEAKTYFVENYKRPIWVTKKAYQNHVEKKEFEYLDKLDMQMTTQSDINLTAARMLGNPSLANSPEALTASPFLYGYDITSTSLIKYTSLKKLEYQTPYTVGTFDIETNPKTDEIILATVAYRNKTYTGILSKFVKNVSDVKIRVKKAIEVYLKDYKDLDWEIEIFNNEVDLLKAVFKVANAWKPVFLATWNINFDYPKIMSRLKHFNVNPIDVICDQSIPRNYRYCRYQEGTTKKITASGKVQPVNPSLQWHTLTSTSTFYVIDAMCAYRNLRMGKPEETSYSLDNILGKEIKTQKLKFDAAKDYKGLSWHLFMQENYPVEYIVYNIYDCTSMLDLDSFTKDLSSALPDAASTTDFRKFNSQGKKITDAFFLFAIENKGRVIGTVAKKKRAANVAEDIDLSDDSDSIPNDDDDEEEDENNVAAYDTLGLRGWIQMLPQNLLMHEGLTCLEEYPNVVTNIRGITCDLDATAAYPTDALIANISKETCVNELITISGIAEEVFREQNLGICIGQANLLEYFNVMFDLPKLTDIDIDAL